MPKAARTGWLADSVDDPDGFAVFGRYPRGFLRHVVRLGLLGPVRREEILHVCSGMLSETELWTVDIRREARSRIQATGTALPFRDSQFAAVMLDPPYSDEAAKQLYGIENPRPSQLLREAARVVRPTGRIGFLHVAVPFTPPSSRMIKVYGKVTEREAIVDQDEASGMDQYATIDEVRAFALRLHERIKETGYPGEAVIVTEIQRFAQRAYDKGYQAGQNAMLGPRVPAVGAGPGASRSPTGLETP